MDGPSHSDRSLQKLMGNLYRMEGWQHTDARERCSAPGSSEGFEHRERGSLNSRDCPFLLFPRRHMLEILHSATFRVPVESNAAKVHQDTSEDSRSWSRTRRGTWVTETSTRDRHINCISRTWLTCAAFPPEGTWSVVVLFARPVGTLDRARPTSNPQTRNAQ